MKHARSADLANLELSRFDQPGGKQELAKQLHEAIKKIGFFYIINFGLSQDAVDRQFWVKDHTNFGSLTLLFRQPVAALQVRTPDGEWKWVKPHPGSITVNVADSLEFLTNGFLKSSIHHVMVPPPNQRDTERLGVLCFIRPEDNVELKPVASKVLERLGFDQVTDKSAVGITAGEWVKAGVAKGVGKGLHGEAEEVPIISSKKTKYYD
ncbi:hypothetical protein ARSEF4850_007549 [Beauveria asiatica]